MQRRLQGDQHGVGGGKRNPERNHGASAAGQNASHPIKKTRGMLAQGEPTKANQGDSTHQKNDATKQWQGSKAERLQAGIKSTDKEICEENHFKHTAI